MAVIWHMRIACWITKATHSHSEYVTLLLVHDKNGKRERPQYYVFTYIDNHVFLVRVSFVLYWWTRCYEPVARPNNPTKCLSNAVEECFISEARKHSPSQEFPTFYEILQFIILFRKACH